jgi:hypothetical protein
MHPEWSEAKIAAAARLHRRTLYKYPKYRAARHAARSGSAAVKREGQREVGDDDD